MQVCNVCSRVFKDSSNGYKAEYYLKNHKKNCDRLLKKKQKAFIKNWIINIANDIEINNVYNFIQDLPVDLPVDSKQEEESQEEQSYDLERWEYQGTKYWLDIETQEVYDDNDILIGKRFINDLENYEIEYEDRMWL